ncbi:hypothetical protein PROFUN_03808 [Planoprotostelium fungivorum]|uniref:Uncharacterized protein n=1 Tax=Planoprotostelium fungivorum TaxID=1890364 RepID=A0A2P6NI65_9EUKA|nr:hypothetical protein PROFUN_03808 [Planoprotostelium fungivorum]
MDPHVRVTETHQTHSFVSRGALGLSKIHPEAGDYLHSNPREETSELFLKKEKLCEDEGA